jgi:hypothetical protein
MSGSVSGRTAVRPRVAAGGHDGQTPTMLTSLGGARARGSRGLAPCPAARRMSCHVRGAAAGPPRGRAGVRRAQAAGHLSGRQTAADTGIAMDISLATLPDTAVRTAVAPEATDGQSADRSGSLQLPLLFLKAGLRAGLVPRPVLGRQRHDGHRGTGLTHHTRQAIAESCPSPPILPGSGRA